MSVVESTLAQMPNEDSDETHGWDDGMKFAESMKAEVLKELASLRKLNYSDAYIDAWKASAESVFYDMTREEKDNV